jgi:hypothetical protein
MPLNCWVVFPSATTIKADAAVDAWSARGYRTLIYQDIGAFACRADIVRFGRFPGYYRIINELVEAALCEGADVVTCAGDDMLPDPDFTAEEIGTAYLKQFPNGEGVLQACGDPQGPDDRGVAAAARICGSPTFGREWIMRSYKGNGPFYTGYHSYYGDEDLWNVAQAHQALWLAPQFIFKHLHWSFGHMERTPYQKRNSDQHWFSDAELFCNRKAMGFPGSELIAI